MEKLRKDIVGYCGGIPLVITVLGGLLATKQLKEWEDVLKHLKPALYEQQDLQLEEMIALKYNNLPYHLKPCFLYLGHFPKDFEIPAKKLIQMWMGEGFIPQIQLAQDRENTMENEGKQYLQELVKRGMVQVGKSDSFGIKTCRIPDLMRDFCISKAKGENFLQITDVHSIKGSQVLTGKIRRLAIISEPGSNFSLTKFNKNPYLRSLLYHVPSKAYWFKESSFQKFKLLRVLSLENFLNYRGELPKDIGCLIHLRFLSIKDSNIDKVPSSIGYLSCLQTLDLRSLGRDKLTCTDAVFILLFTACGFTTCCGFTCHDLFTSIHRGVTQSDSRDQNVRLPNVFKKMEQLRHLYLPYEYSVSVKLELGNLCYLQTLVNVKPETIQISKDFKLDPLRVLVLRNNSVSLAEDAIAKAAIGILSKCPNIDKLNLCYSIKMLPAADQFPPKLAKLTLEQTNLEKDPMTTLEKLANLKILRLTRAFKGNNMTCSKEGFPELETLVLSKLYNLEEWTVKEGTMPKLSRLEIKECKKLERTPNGLKSIKSLQELEIKAMQKSFRDSLDIIQHVPSIVIQD